MIYGQDKQDDSRDKFNPLPMTQSTGGLTLREQAAIAALQGVIEGKYGLVEQVLSPKLAVTLAVRLADALVDELEKTKKDEKR